MGHYNYALLDPRNIPAAAEANDKVFANPVYGIEVTVPALAKRCIFNLDPQHSGGDANRAAIEDALTAELPTEGSTLATVRADLDAVAPWRSSTSGRRAKALTPRWSGSTWLPLLTSSRAVATPARSHSPPGITRGTRRRRRLSPPVRSRPSRWRSWTSGSLWLTASSPWSGGCLRVRSPSSTACRSRRSGST